MLLGEKKPKRGDGLIKGKTKKGGYKPCEENFWVGENG